MSESSSKRVAKGDLSFDSPGVWNMLKGAFLEPELAQIWCAYAVAAKLGALDDKPVRRASGASFNPRPARLMHILLSEAAEKRAVVIAAAAFACVDITTPCPPAYTGMREWDLGCLSRNYARSAFNSAEKAEACAGAQAAAAEAVACAYLLDELRHLHMTGLSREDRTAAMSRAESFLTNRSFPAQYARLSALTQQALDRCRRNKGE